MAPAYQLFGGGLSKGTMASAHTMPNTSVSLCITLVPFKLPPWCWSTEVVSLSRQVHVWVPQEELLRPPTASPNDNLCWFSQPEVEGTYLPSTGILGRGPGVGLGLLAPEISLTNFYPHGCGASSFYLCDPPTSLGGCGFFNSIVIQLPFNWIADMLE